MAKLVGTSLRGEARHASFLFVSMVVQIWLARVSLATARVVLSRHFPGVMNIVVRE